mgnify:CR=1 FL=1
MNDFYIGWPYYGQYVEKLNQIENDLYNYLINFPILDKKYSVIFDIDDTLLFTDQSKVLHNKKINNNLLPKINQICKIVQLCKTLNFKIIILTARPLSSYIWSVNNLNYHKIPFDEIYHNNNWPDINFKIQFKKELSLKENIILSVGDQFPDIQGLQDCLCIKLPSIQDKNAYFTFDNRNYNLI